MGLGLHGRRPLSAADRAMLAGLVREVGPRLLAYVRRTYGRGVEADDILAETFCRAAANMRTLRACERQDLYLLKTARNLCRDGFRRPRMQTFDAEPERPASAADPPAAVDASERDTAVAQAVARLPETQREIVALRVSADLSFEQIATLLNIPLGTALSRMHAAVQKLRQELGTEYVVRT
jgi:RNA polymerase sigma-70 factor, ECF subfamily